MTVGSDHFSRHDGENVLVHFFGYYLIVIYASLVAWEILWTPCRNSKPWWAFLRRKRHGVLFTSLLIKRRKKFSRHWNEFSFVGPPQFTKYFTHMGTGDENSQHAINRSGKFSRRAQCLACGWDNIKWKMKILRKMRKLLPQMKTLLLQFEEIFDLIKRNHGNAFFRYWNLRR